jgi:hypothetical protein
MIMSTATIGIAASERHAATVRLLARLGSRLSEAIYRLLEQLPEQRQDVDLEVFKRVPVPI